MGNKDEGRDWFEGEAEKAQEEQKAKAISFAQIYLVFVNNPRAKELLEHWEATLVNKQTPVSAPLQVYAADEAVRDFIRGIRRQIALAQEPQG